MIEITGWYEDGPSYDVVTGTPNPLTFGSDVVRTAVEGKKGKGKKKTKPAYHWVENDGGVRALLLNGGNDYDLTYEDKEGPVVIRVTADDHLVLYDTNIKDVVLDEDAPVIPEKEEDAVPALSE